MIGNWSGGNSGYPELKVSTSSVRRFDMAQNGKTRHRQRVASDNLFDPALFTGARHRHPPVICLDLGQSATLDIAPCFKDFSYSVRARVPHDGHGTNFIHIAGKGMLLRPESA
jgi:hypothetical protein